MANNSIKILVIDDLQDNLITLNALIKDAFTEAITLNAQSGKKGLELAAKENPDVILLDIIMPGMDGYEVCHKLKADKKLCDIPVVFVTAIENTKEALVKALESGGEAFLTKPIDEIELTAQIRAMLKIREANIAKKDEKVRLEQLVEERSKALVQELEARMQAEGKLWESERKTTTLLGNLPGMAYRCKNISEWTMEFVSEGCVELTGYQVDDIIGNKVISYNEIIHPEDRKMVWEAVQESVKKDQHFEMEYRIITNDKKEKWVWERGKHVSFDKEKQDVLEGFISDITERKQAEEALKESEEKFRVLYDNAPLSYQSLNEDGSFKDVNPTWLSTLGYQRDEVIGKFYKDFLHPDWQAHFEKNFPAFKKCGYVNDLQFKIRHKKGHYLDISIEGCIGYNPDGSFKQTYCVFQDITERRKAEDKLKDSEERFNLAMNASNDGLFDWDLLTNEIYYSPAWKKMIGYEDHELPNDFSVWEKTTAPEDVNKSWELQQKLISKQIDRFVIEFKMKHKDGHWVYILSRARAFFDDEGKAIRIVGTHTDITKRKQTEEKLQESEEKFRKSFTTSPDSININRLEDGMYISINDGFTKITGYSESDVIGKTSLEINIWDKPGDRKKLVEGLRKHSQVQNIEAQFRMKDGKVVYGLMSSSVITLDGIPHIISITRDITKRKQAEIELTKLSTAVTQSPSVIIITDTDGQIEYVNPKFTEITGYSVEEVTGQNTRVLKSGEQSDEFYKALWETISSGKEWRGEFHNKKKNGELFWEMASVSPIFNEQGKIVNYIKVAEDITRQKLMTETSIENETKFRTLFDRVADAIFIYDPETFELIEANEATAKIYGYQMDELIGMSILEFSAEVEKSESLAKIINEKGKADVKLRHHKKKDGTDLFLQLQGYKIVVNNKQLCFAVCHDITEAVQVEHDLKLALEKAQESDRLKSAFLATMSHELRTPLNSIIGFSDLIDKNTPIEDAVQYSHTINTSGNHLLNIVEDLFDISLIEAGQFKTDKHTIDLLSVLHEINEIVENEQKSMEKSHLDLRLKIPSKIEKINLTTDESKFKQLLINLLKNALKFTHEGHIHFGFELESKKNRLKFYVEDTGIGISKDKQEMIFDVFRQVDETYTKTYGGTGIGLSLSKKIVEILGGEIWVESEENKGSTFYFTIPYDADKNVGQRKISEIQESKNPHKEYKNKMVLVVEDDDSSYEYLNVLLTKQGINVLKAENGEEAIKYCKEQSDIDLVLMDINMPVMNGYESTKEIKKFRPDLPIIAQTAYAIAGDKEKSLKAGCDDYISKPIKKEKLKALIQKYLK